MSDLRFRGEVPSPAEAAALDALLGSVVPGPEGLRHLLLPALHAVHDVSGWISPGGLDEVCRRLGVAPAEAYGVASFYALFSLEPRPPRVLHVCVDLACRMAGAGDLTPGLPADGEGVVPGSGVPPATWEESPCLGLCERAPAALVVTTGRSVTKPSWLRRRPKRWPAPSGPAPPPPPGSPGWRPPSPSGATRRWSCCAGSGWWTPPASTTTGPRVATPLCAGRWPWAPPP